MTSGGVDPGEVAAAVAASRELGPAYDDAVAEALVARVEAAVAARGQVDLEQVREAAAERREVGKRQLALAVVSLGTGIPITAIAAALADLPGLAVAWLGIAAVNAAHAVGSRRPSPPRS